MARWYATGLNQEPFGELFEAPDRRQALDRATARYGARCYGVISLLMWEDVLARRQARARAKRVGFVEDEDDPDNAPVFE